MAPKYTSRRGGVWYVQMPVPKALQAAVGCKVLQRSLRTSDEAKANRDRHSVIAEFQERIEQARKAPAPMSSAGLLELARHLHSSITAGRVGRGAAAMEWDASLERYLSLRAAEVGTDEEGHPDLPAAEVATLRRASAAFSGDEARMLDRLAERWLKHEESSALKRATVQDKRNHLAMFIGWAGAYTDVTTFNKERAGAYVEEVLIPWGRTMKINRQVGDVTAATKRKALNSVRQFFDWLEVRDTIKANPFDKVSTLIRTASRGVVEEVNERVWAPEEVLQFLRFLPQDDPMWPLAVLQAYTGARPDELCAMKVANVSEEVMFNPSGKTPAARRQIPIHPVIAPMVKRLKATSTDGFLIPGLLTSGPDDKRGKLVGKRLALAVRAAGLTDPDLNPYRFRHTVMSQMEAAGVVRYVRKQVVGHKSMDITEDVYTAPPAVRRRLNAIKRVDYGKEVTALVQSVGKKLAITYRSQRRKPRNA